MSRTTKWKLEKMKVKVVFRLQFNATYIPHTGWDKLVVSLIPSDSGKVTAKTSKSHVRNGICKWADPIYETTRLLQDTKTKQYDEKLYKLVVAMGSSRSGLLGEANINLADYADASKPSSVALPLHGCNSGSVLHVTVQLLTSKTGFREFEQQSELRERGLQAASHQNIHDEPPEKLSTSSRVVNGQIEKVNSKVRFQSESSEIPSLGEVELTEDYGDSAAAIDNSSNTSESLYAEKQYSSAHENESLKSTTSGDMGGISLSHSPQPEKGDPSRLLAQGGNDWVHGYSSDYSMDNDLIGAYEENSRLRGSLDMAESSILELKQEMSSIQSYADELGVETHKCCQLLAKEMDSGKELAKEVSVLKSDCSKFKDDFHKLKHYKLNHHLTGKDIISNNFVQLFQGLQVRCLQGICTMEDKVSKVQNKVCHIEPEIRSDLEALQQFLEDLKQDIAKVNDFLDAKLTEQMGENEIGVLSVPEPVQFVQGNKPVVVEADQYEGIKHVLQDLKQDKAEPASLLSAKVTEQNDEKEIGVLSVPVPVQYVQGNKLDAVDADQCKGVNQCLSRYDQVSQMSHPFDATIMLRDIISELQRELEESKGEQDSLTRKLEQMECCYEAFIQELEENQKQMLGELHELRKEHSTCMFTIATCNTQMEKMHKDMNEQLLRFSEEKHVLDSVNKELERRAIASEAALHRARWNSSIAVDQLQKDLELLSFQVLSMFKTNENLIKQSFAETSQSGFQVFPEESLEALESSLHTDYSAILQNQFKTRLQDCQSVVSVSQKNKKVPGTDAAISLAKIIGAKNSVEVHDKALPRDLDGLDTLFLPNTVSEPTLESGTIECQHCQNQNAELKRQLSSAKILLDESERSLHLQEEVYHKAEDELVEMHLININLDVFSKVLQEVLYEASSGIVIMKEKMDVFSQKLAHSTDSEELLKFRLQTAIKDISTLREYNDNWSTKCDELTLHNQLVEEKLHTMSNESDFLNQKIMEYEKLIMEYRSYQSNYEECIAKKAELMGLLEKETSIKCRLQGEVSSKNDELKMLKDALNEQLLVNNNLENTFSFLEDKLGHLRSTMLSYGNHISEQLLSGPIVHDVGNKELMSIVLHLEELQNQACEKILQLTMEKKDMEEQRDTAERLQTSSESEIMFMKKNHELDLHGMVNRLGVSTDLVDKHNQELEHVANKLRISIESEERYADQLLDLSSKLSVFEVELQNVSNENRDLTQKILSLECVSEELEKTKLAAVDSARENEFLALSLQSGSQEFLHLSNELSVSTEKLKCMVDALNSERSLRIKLEGVIVDLTSEVKMKNDLLIPFDEEKAAVVHLKKQVSDLEQEKSSACHLLLRSEEGRRKADEFASSVHLQITDLEAHLTASQEYAIAADVELVYTKNQFQARMQDLVKQLESLDGCYRELHLKHLDVLSTLNSRISSEARYVEENARLLTALDSLRSELEVNVNEKTTLVNENNAISDELEKYKTMEAMTEQNNIQKNRQHEQELFFLKPTLTSAEVLIDNLKSSRDEMEITITVIKAKLKEYDNAVMMLQTQKSELCQRLSDQILKTEEFKNLSVHLKELKDEAEAECLKAREKRESEVPSIAQQESLRMAFIREQGESKVQELRNQLYVSKKHGEELLLKLQDALEDVASRRKSEASQIKRNEELLRRILELETELQMVLSDKWEKVKALDKMKADLECSLISLDCCKEEKQKMEASLQECIREKSKVAVELESVKENLKISIGSEREVKPSVVEPLSTEPFSKEASSEEDAFQVFNQEVHPSKTVINQEDLKQLALINERFKGQSLRLSMEHLHEELERMKNENLVSLPIDVKQFEPVFHGLQRQLLQLQKANEQLGSIFPLFNEFPGSGNALERVLALELELAEALQSKKTSNIHFQSSFLKQHADEEAVFQSFRDINELIKDMLEMKGKYVTVETELKEMHDRYSQLSLQFAEVEGERQRLVMRLKNSRSPKKSPPLYRSTSASLEDHP